MIVTPFLRNVLYLDVFVSGAAGLLMIVGAPVLSGLLGLPEPLLFWGGVVLVPFVVILAVVARRESVSRLMMLDIVGLNLLWVIASFALLLTGAVAPNALGVAFVVVQALAVAVFAGLQSVAIRRTAAPAVG